MMAAPESLVKLVGKNAHIRINRDGEIVISFPGWRTRKTKAGEFTARETAEIKSFAIACGGEITPAKFMTAIGNRKMADTVFTAWVELVQHHPIEPERFFAWKNVIEKLSGRETV